MKKKGFTLIETIVVIFIFSLTIATVGGLIAALYRINDYNWKQATTINEARRGIETMVKEIREAREGENGSYPIEKAQDKEFIFYSDIDDDGQTEKVRYFLGTVSSGSQTKECLSFAKGGSCNVDFSGFLSGELKSAQIKISVEGDLGASNEYVEIYADGAKLGNFCQTNCSDCAGDWQGTAVLDIKNQVNDNSVQFLADAANSVNPSCDWLEPNHSFKARFELNWDEEITEGQTELKKAVTDPVGSPPEYPSGQEKVYLLSSYVRNTPPIFRYFDENGNELIELPARLKDTKVMEVFLVVNADPNRLSQNFELKSAVQLRNLKNE